MMDRIFSRGLDLGLSVALLLVIALFNWYVFHDLARFQHILDQRTKLDWYFMAACCVVPLIYMIFAGTVAVRSKRVLTSLIISCAIYIELFIVLFAEIFYKLGVINLIPLDLDSMGQKKDFASCLYFSTMTFTTVGYGDYIPSPRARLFACGEALMGYFMLAVMFTIVNTLLAGKPQDNGNSAEEGR
jgi:hypothetical protein